MVSANQIESTNDWKYIGSGTTIGIAIACLRKNGLKRDMECDQDDHFCAPIELNKNRNIHLIENNSKHMTVADDGHQHNF